ncbi:MAG: ABC transporter permease [Salinibacterium sp.]|nr:MAG: ABC transporter permease [Salinibacterium sp.]
MFPEAVGISQLILSTEPLKSAAPPRALWAGTKYSVRAVWAHRELLSLLVRREIKSRYKDSSLGFFWSLAKPLTQLLIYYVAVGKFLGADRAIPQFAIFIFTGLTIWALFSEIISSTTSSIVDNSGLVKKVYVPRELFPLAAVGSSLVNFGIQFGILTAAVLATQPPPFFGDDLWLLPLALIALILLSLAFGLFLSAANVYLRDIKHLIEVGLVVLFWASPIVYSFDMVHGALDGSFLEQVYLWNPMTVAILSFQRVFWRAGTHDTAIYWPPDLAFRLVIISIVSLALVWVAQRFFAKLEGNFAQEL